MGLSILEQSQTDPKTESPVAGDVKASLPTPGRSEWRSAGKVPPLAILWERWQVRSGMLPQSNMPVSRSGLYTDFT